MNKSGELPGTVVLVHPNLLTDPANKKNQIGIIISADLENDNVLVSFGDEGVALFSSNALFILREPDDIRHAALLDETLMPYPDFYDIMEACTLAELSLHREAIRIAMENPMVLEYAMDRLDYELGLNRHNGMGR